VVVRARAVELVITPSNVRNILHELSQDCRAREIDQRSRFADVGSLGTVLDELAALEIRRQAISKPIRRSELKLQYLELSDASPELDLEREAARKELALARQVAEQAFVAVEVESIALEARRNDLEAKLAQVLPIAAETLRRRALDRLKEQKAFAEAQLRQRAGELASLARQALECESAIALLTADEHFGTRVMSGVVQAAVAKRRGIEEPAEDAPAPEQPRAILPIAPHGSDPDARRRLHEVIAASAYRH
jgi:hypothetical protein